MDTVLGTEYKFTKYANLLNINMKLITEINEEIEVLTEETSSGNKSYFIEGVFLQGNIKNRNGRIYPIDILRSETENYITNYVNQNRAFGELGHPEGPTINLERVSHMIKTLRLEGNNYVGKAKILDSPYGKIVKNLIDEGAKLGVSSRGIGSVSSRGDATIVNGDFRLSTAADIVADPSAPQAFVRGIMESKEWVWDNGIIRAKEIEEYKKEIQKASQKKLEEKMIWAFTDFTTKLAKKAKI